MAEESSQQTIPGAWYWLRVQLSQLEWRRRLHKLQSDYDGVAGRQTVRSLKEHGCQWILCFRAVTLSGFINSLVKRGKACSGLSVFLVKVRRWMLYIMVICILTPGFSWSLYSLAAEGDLVLRPPAFFFLKKKNISLLERHPSCDVFHGDLGLNPAAVSPFMHSRQYLSNEMQYTFLNSTHLRQVSSIVSDFFSKPLLELWNSYCQDAAFMIFQIYKDVCPPHTHRITLILSCFYFYVFIPNVCGNHT